jgi:hypothetical protein
MKRTTLINPGKTAGLSMTSPRIGIVMEVQKMKIANATTIQAIRKSRSCFDIFYSPLITKSPLTPGRCERIGLALFHVIPAKAGIQCFRGVTNILDPGFHRGDEYSSILSRIPLHEWRARVVG